jgi:hypothetical protein
VTWRPESLNGSTEVGAPLDQRGRPLLWVDGTVMECSFRRGQYLLSLETAAGRVEGISSEPVSRDQRLSLALNLNEVRAYAH